jgi:hypothetical protein
MSDFNIDDVLSQFGSKPAAASKSKDFDVDAILKEFDTSAPTAEAKPTERIYVSPAKPPISGVSKEASDELNRRPDNPGGANPRAWMPKVDIPTKIGENFNSGIDLAGSGLTDLQTQHPYKGFGKAALGVFQAATSPISGIIEGGIADPITDITGNKEIGDRAGFVAASAIPVVPGGGAVVKALPKNKMLSKIVEDITNKGENPQALVDTVQRMRENSRLSPVDYNPKVLQTTQELFANGGPVNYLKNTSTARMGGAKDAVETAYDAATGKPVNALEKVKALQQEAKDVGSQQINPAIAGAKPVDITPVLEHIDNIVKPGVNRVITSETTLPSTEINSQLKQIRAMLANAKEQRTDPQALHHFQSVLRQEAETLLNRSDGQSARMGNALMKVRNELVNVIDKASGGKYKPALSNYRDAKQIDDAFHHGYDGIFTNSKKLEGRPEFTEDWFSGLSDAEKQAAREGARLQLDTQINNFRFAARKGMEIPEVEFNRQKLELLFGKEKTDKLIKALKDERAIADTHNKVVEGSQTAMRSNTKAENKPPIPTDYLKSVPAIATAEAANYFIGGTPLIGSAVVGGAKIAGKATDVVKQKLYREQQARYAKYALPTEGPSRDALIKALEARIPSPKPSLLTRGSNALSRIVAP